MNCIIRVVKTKALISFAVTAKLICIFVFAYADCWFSHEGAQMSDAPAPLTPLAMTCFLLLFQKIEELQQENEKMKTAIGRLESSVSYPI